MYHPVTAKGTPIYVHSKLMIVDDRIVRVGSSNINNRSLRFDMECDVAFEARPTEEAANAAKALRVDLLGEHLGMSAAAFEAAEQSASSTIAAIESARITGSAKTLIPYETPAISDLEKWLADNEILDPEGPEEMFEPIERRGLFRGWHWRRAGRK
jgi:phosphatidylserine/phosphatidylglycerophosphate/cardiolipin synthase-like enzyme